MPLKLGQPLPEITLKQKTDAGLVDINLRRNVGKGKTVILFVPLAFTGVCTQQFCAISGGLGEYADLNCKVFGISGDNPFAQAAWAEKEGITLKLLSDYDHKATAAYGTTYDQFLPEKNLIMGGVSKRSAFIVDKAGVVQYAEVNDSPGDLPNSEAIKAKLAELS